MSPNVRRGGERTDQPGRPRAGSFDEGWAVVFDLDQEEELPAQVMPVHNDMQPDEGGGAEADARMDGEAIEVRFVPHHVRF